MAQNSDVARVAREVCAAAKQGGTSHTIGRVVFDLRRTGRCMQFVRECHEAALGLEEYTWRWRAPSAACAEHNYHEAGQRVGKHDAQPGDVLGLSTNVPLLRWDNLAWQKRTGRYGHIGIWLGDGEFAENTSSQQRGPGTVISRLGDPGVPVDRPTGFYRLVESAKDSLIVTLVGPDGEAIPCELRGDELWSETRATAIAVGGDVLAGPEHWPHCLIARP